MEKTIIFWQDKDRGASLLQPMLPDTHFFFIIAQLNLQSRQWEAAHCVGSLKAFKVMKVDVVSQSQGSCWNRGAAIFV